jgi:hypothetical protein
VLAAENKEELAVLHDGLNGAGDPLNHLFSRGQVARQGGQGVDAPTESRLSLELLVVQLDLM